MQISAMVSREPICSSIASNDGAREGHSSPQQRIRIVRLSNGVEMPELALGTAPLAISSVNLPNHPTSQFMGFLPEQALRSVTVALQSDSSIRHIDTALYYRTQRPIGSVLGSTLASGELKRSDVFLTTKVFQPNDGFGTSDACLPLNLESLSGDEIRALVQRQVEQCLVQLGVGYIDLLLLHWPGQAGHAKCGNYERRLAAWKVLEEVYARGWARAIGVSNFQEEHLEELRLANCQTPMVNQFEASVFLQHSKILGYCQSHGIVPSAYSPLGRGVNQVCTHPVIQHIAKEYGKDTGQVAIKYLLQKGYAVVFWTSSEQRIQSNPKVYDFTLNADDMAQLDGLNRPDGTWGLISPYEIA